jgi:Na+/pantothenate symporter
MDRVIVVSATFNNKYIRAVSFIGGGNQSNPPYFRELLKLG